MNSGMSGRGTDRLIILIGDSYAKGSTCGSATSPTEIAQVMASDVTVEPYGKRIATACNVPYKLYARNGASNTMISQFVVSAIHQAIKSGISPRNILILAGWTTTGRVDFFSKSRNRTDTLKVMSKTDHVLHGLFRELDGVSLSDVSPLFDHPPFLYQQTLHAINYANSVADMHGVRIINLHNLTIWKTNYPLSTGCVNIKEQDILSHSLSDTHRNIVERMLSQPSFQQIAQKRQWMDASDHPFDEGHAFWAQKILEDNGNVFKEFLH